MQTSRALNRVSQKQKTTLPGARAGLRNDLRALKHHTNELAMVQNLDLVATKQLQDSQKQLSLLKQHVHFYQKQIVALNVQIGQKRTKAANEQKKITSLNDRIASRREFIQGFTLTNGERKSDIQIRSDYDSVVQELPRGKALMLAKASTKTYFKETVALELLRRQAATHLKTAALPLLSAAIAEESAVALLQKPEHQDNTEPSTAPLLQEDKPIFTQPDQQPDLSLFQQNPSNPLQAVEPEEESPDGEIVTQEEELIDPTSPTDIKPATPDQTPAWYARLGLFNSY